MKREIDLKIGLVCLLLVLSGCQLGPVETDTPTPGELERGGFNNFPDVRDYDDSFFYAGTIRIHTPVAARNDTFENVTLCLYDRGGNVLNYTVIGDLKGRFDSTTYAIGADERPEYIAFDHPRFYDYESMSPLTLAWTENGGYRQYRTSLGSIQNDFEYPRHNETGRCL